MKPASSKMDPVTAALERGTFLGHALQNICLTNEVDLSGKTPI